MDQTSGGAPLAHRDALKLLAAMIQHTDNKPQQQRLVCLDKVHGMTPQEDGSCKHPFMMINDLGKTFGQATLTNADKKSAVNFEAWSEHADLEGCEGMRRPAVEVVHAARSSIRRSARAAGSSSQDLLSQLTDQQLRDLFEVARFTKRDPKVSVDDWVARVQAEARRDRERALHESGSLDEQEIRRLGELLSKDFSYSPTSCSVCRFPRPASRVTRPPRLPDRFSPA